MHVDPTYRAEVERDQAERLSEDDQAVQREAEFRSLAFLQHRLRAAGQRPAVPGVCTNCDERCLPLAVYCDPECRDDHERRLVLGLRERGQG